MKAVKSKIQKFNKNVREFKGSRDMVLALETIVPFAGVSFASIIFGLFILVPESFSVSLFAPWLLLIFKINFWYLGLMITPIAFGIGCKSAIIEIYIQRQIIKKIKKILKIKTVSY